jgi:general secretion pathway protein C
MDLLAYSPNWGFLAVALKDNRRMLARLVSLVVWACVAASAAFWALKLTDRKPAPIDSPVNSSRVSDPAIRSELARLLGGAALPANTVAQAPAMNSRFHLAAVIASPGVRGAGVAVIAVDGKKARAFRVGAPIDGSLVLQSVGFRSASIGPAQGPPAVVLELQALPLPLAAPFPAPAATAADAAGPVGAGLVPATPAIRKSTPGERSPGRRLRLRHGVESAP